MTMKYYALKNFILISSMITTIIGVSVLIGWKFNIDVLKSAIPGQITMKLIPLSA